MASNDQTRLFSEQPAFFSSLNTIVATGTSTAFSPRLPPIPEQDWDFNWEEDTFPLSSPYEGFEQTTTTIKPAADDNSLPQTNEELTKLQNEVRQLRYDISELNEMFCKRLNTMETSLVGAQRYVNNLVPWSMEVHEKYSQLLAIAMKQEDRATDRVA
ncbi:hypothetical protein COCCADRAFT_9874 [Bipolaris zeicola 26-R-13]|uniref:Uncharacterized protein n=1 Tax=Cochliobolus carbonum (strain 26-R-13) TaxID=930089 RepID=W6XXU8_COCC2|nr:uncharacterized protein COCCADRAFT_9874 [Bipolaris zeicola 26-R-13]EUC27559.1 hypothetical protein COCCADRAFT_9874 [Bipolaris zeicola 26-R-13]